MASTYPTYKLGEVAEVILGQSPDSKSYNTSHDGLPFFQGKSEFTEWHPIPNKWCTEPKKIAEPLDILLSVRAPVGPTNVAKERCCIGRGLAAIRYTDCYKYVLYYLRSVCKYLESKATGTTFQAISGDVIKKLPIPLPPLATQHAIVTRIETLFAELDKGVEKLKTAQQQLKVYRQAVLNETMNAAKFVSVGEVVLEMGQGWSPKCCNEPSLSDNEWGVIKTTAIQSCCFVEEENKKLPKNLEPRLRHELKVGDVLITRAGPKVRVGVCCLIKKIRPRLINCDKAYRILLNKELIVAQYFEYVINSPTCAKKIDELKTGISDSGVNLTQNRFMELAIPLPSLPEQQRIVQEIETRLSACDEVEKQIAESLQQAEALRQSILKKAFSGELV